LKRRWARGSTISRLSVLIDHRLGVTGHFKSQVSGKHQLRQPAAAERLVEADDRLQAREPRLRQRVLGLVQRLADLQQRDQI